MEPTDNPIAPTTPTSQLEVFRAKTKRRKIHPREVAALCVIGTHFVFLPWALGGMRIWTQVIGLVLAATGMVIALLPRDYTPEHSGGAAFRLIMWPKLLKFPIFWLGLLLLGLIVCQAFNPAWEYKTDGTNWWMAAVPHNSSLPTGVRAPFDKWNQWRMLVIYSSVWLTICSMWVAITRRHTLQRLLIAITVNGVILAALGVSQRLAGNGKIFWFFTSPNPHFFSSFIYKNHGGAFLLITLGVTSGLAGWYYIRGVRRMEKSNPSGVLAFCATCIAVSIVTSYARGATLVMLVFLLPCIVAFLIYQFRVPSETRRPIITFALLVLFAIFLKIGAVAIHSGNAWQRIKQGINREDSSLATRERSTAATLEMLRDYWPKGAGTGAFRFLFPTYQHRDLRLVADESGRRMFWEHAHNDVAEYLVEWGALGTIIFGLGSLYWIVALVRTCFWQNPLSTCTVFGALLLVSYAWWDFPFQCPAILLSWSALWPTAVMWARFEEPGSRS